MASSTALLRQHRFTALGGPCSLHFAADDEAAWTDAAQAAEAEARRVEAKYSRYRPESEVSRINACAGDPAGILVDEETAGLLDYAHAAYEQSEGLFDITSGVLRRAWDFRSGRLPAPGELDALLPLVGWSSVRWDPPRIVLPRAGMELDFGGFGKEYAVDRVSGILVQHGIRCGVVEFGGDLRVLGPRPDGTPWRIGIRHPRAPDKPIAAIDLVGGALATSGDYERFFEHQGRRYCHILDPRTGFPVPGPASVSVLAEQCLLAGTMTTIGMLKGTGARRWLQDSGLPWLLVEPDGGIAGTLAPRVK